MSALPLRNLKLHLEIKNPPGKQTKKLAKSPYTLTELRMCCRTLFFLQVSKHAVIGQFSGPYSPARTAKI